ncbi:mediator of RNA polymerase II transcription subunit 12 [Aspergillus luchuensis]|uniref:Mediator of RNA polymerase II transcription subunit 12 n=1 Tax=Aspergillus kawachii TaxID=1069201 RepID=A0A146FCN0_ASPKA|nr:mediator of RNA polymerase II transcription subunit 12 [Aspergillus luchuensis]
MSVDIKVRVADVLCSLYQSGRGRFCHCAESVPLPKRYQPPKTSNCRQQWVESMTSVKEDDESLPPAKTIGRGDAAMKLARQDRLMMSLKRPTPQTPRVITI